MARSFPSKASGPLFVLYGGIVAFVVYFSMYGFRKPFAAATFEGTLFFGVERKTAYVIAQLLGYTLSKFIGVRLISGLPQARVFPFLNAAILFAWMSLGLFALVPPSPAGFGLDLLMLFLNGLPLGLVWGLVVRYLEGRRSSELLLAMLSASFIVASGAVKDIGRALLNAGVPETLMPAAVGAIFLVPYALGTVALSRLPPPTGEDKAARSPREPMGKAERHAFIQSYPLTLVLLLVVFVALTAYRDFRDNYGVEILAELGLENQSAAFTQAELPVAFAVILALAFLSFVRRARAGLIAVFVLMTVGVLLLAIAEPLRTSGAIDRLAWLTLTGVGSYLAYVPFGSVLFERLVAFGRLKGTAVFAIYLADALGYAGSVALQLSRDLLFGNMSRLAFFDVFTFWLGALGAAMLAVSLVFALRKGGKEVSPS